MQSNMHLYKHMSLACITQNHVHTRTHMQACTHTHTRTHACTHTRTHTHQLLIMLCTQKDIYKDCYSSSSKKEKPLVNTITYCNNRHCGYTVRYTGHTVNTLQDGVFSRVQSTCLLKDFTRTGHYSCPCSQHQRKSVTSNATARSASHCYETFSN